jgi:hypothetical protein
MRRNCFNSGVIEKCSGYGYREVGLQMERKGNAPMGMPGRSWWTQLAEQQ